MAGAARRIGDASRSLFDPRRPLPQDTSLSAAFLRIIFPERPSEGPWDEPGLKLKNRAGSIGPQLGLCVALLRPGCQR